jgi:hypothetical protein
MDEVLIMTASYDAVWEVLNTVLATVEDEEGEGGDGVNVIYDLLERVVDKIRYVPGITLNEAILAVKADYDPESEA